MTETNTRLQARQEALLSQHVQREPHSLNRAQLVNLRVLFSQEIERQQTHLANHPPLLAPQTITDSAATLDKKALMMIKTKIQQIHPTINRLLQL